MEADEIKRLPDAATPESQQSETDLRGLQTNDNLSEKQALPSETSGAGQTGANAVREGSAQPASRTPKHYALRCRGTEGCGCGCASHRAAPSVPRHLREYDEICKRETGKKVDEETFLRNKERKELMQKQSNTVAEQLEEQGIKGFEDTKLEIIGLVSGMSERIIAYRNIVFIPAVAARKRRKMLIHLEYFMDQNPNCRMWVFTSGERTPITGVRDAIGKMHRRLSKLNNQPFMKAAGVQIVFRSTELGSLKRVDGDPTFHLHAHTIVKLQRKLKRDEWIYLLKRVRKWWKFHFSDSKKIHSAREACKYCVKPSDLENLEGHELKVLYEQMFRLHLVQCLGELKEQRKKLKEADLIPRKEGNRWRTITNWNAGRGTPSDKPRSSETEVCKLLPAPYFTREKEPAVIILRV